jgi:hypothetical protein
MIRRLINSAFVILVMVGLAGCSAHAYSVHVQSYGTGFAPLEERADQIKKAGIAAGWTMSETGLGQIRGSQSVRNKDVVVIIDFTTVAFSIRYDSTTYHYNGERVSKRFNVLVKELEEAIIQQS